MESESSEAMFLTRVCCRGRDKAGDSPTSCLVARGGQSCAVEAAAVHVLVEDVPADAVGNLFGA